MSDERLTPTTHPDRVGRPTRRAGLLRWVQIALMIASLPLALLSTTVWAVCMLVLVLVCLLLEYELERQVGSLRLALNLSWKERDAMKVAEARRLELPTPPFEKFPGEWLRGLASAICAAEAEGAFGTEEDHRLKCALAAEFERRGWEIPSAHMRDPWGWGL